MDIAIQFEKYNIDESKFVLKPIGIIKGEYYETSDTFINEFGIECHPITDAEYYETDFFGYAITIDGLKEKYGDSDSEVDLFTNYFEEIQDNFYVGYIKESGVTTLVEIPVSQITECNAEEINNNEGYELEEDEDENTTNISGDIYFSTDEVMAMKNANTIEEVRSYLEVVLSEIKDAKEKSDEQTKRTSKKKIDRDASKKFNVAKLRKEVLSSIIGQDEAVMRLTTKMAVNYTSKNYRNKKHILLVGPSGTGKTEMVNIVADYLDIPVFKADATAYSKEGYVGKSVYSMINGLVSAAGNDIEKAQNGILIIDEIDKKAGTDRGDVSGEAVLHSLLKIMDRTVIEANNDTYGSFRFDTSNLTIICMGAFSELYKSRQSTNPMGFESKKEMSDRPIDKKDLIKYGMPSEFMGRIGNIIFTKEFTFEDIIELLHKSKLSPIKREREWFKDQGVVTVFRKSFYDAIAQRCLSSNTGARDIESLVDESLVNAQDVVLTRKKVKKLIFSADTVNNPQKFSII